MRDEGCPAADVLEAFALGDLDETSLDDIAGHLELCTSCADAVSRLDRKADTLLLDLRRRVIDSSVTATQFSGDSPPARAGEPDPAGRPSEWLDDFRIVREIGRGGMGVVYEAMQVSLGRHVAIKLLREPSDLPRFRREARAAGRLHHTNIVPVYGVGEQGGRCYYVMQYIDGRGLDQVLRARRRGGGAARPTSSNVARLILQAAEAVDHAHGHGIVHRDIKPSNILVDEHGVIRITDFGLAYDADDTETLTRTGDVVGTLRYMAPERFAGRDDAGADIYGLGITLYELATGRPAYPEGDRAVLIHRVMNEDPPRPRLLEPRMPRDLETIALKAMAREPSRRYATAAAMAEDLRRFVEGRPIRARRVGPWEHAARWSRRNRLAAGLLAGLVIVSVTGARGGDDAPAAGRPGGEPRHGRVEPRQQAGRRRDRGAGGRGEAPRPCRGRGGRPRLRARVGSGPPRG